jgi:hypothetical protein
MKLLSLTAKDRGGGRDGDMDSGVLAGDRGGAPLMLYEMMTWLLYAVGFGFCLLIVTPFVVAFVGAVSSAARVGWIRAEIRYGIRRDLGKGE